MSRSRPADGPTVSLFPFLAVLLCTMGSLLVLLVLFSRSARVADQGADEAAARQRQEELELARDELVWRVKQLQDVRERTAADLARERLRLAGAEDDSRRLADELADLERVAAALDADATAAAPAGREDAVAARLASAKESLEKARKDAAARPPAYAVVPYQGANGTHRRPLYIECSLDGVYLQPEGIRLGPADFEGPPGPGNPLASALRAAREHIAVKTSDAGDPAVQPYPLLLVRPSGVMAYYAARESLQSWGSEFGYQFIDEDWTLQYPPADPLLAQAEQRAIDESRRRIAMVGDARRQRPARPTQQFRAATTRGGVVAAGGPSVLGDRSRFDWTEEQAAQAGGEPGRGFSPQGKPGRPGTDTVATGGPGGDVLRGRFGSAATGNGSGGQGTGGSGAGGSGAGGSGAGGSGAGSGAAGQAGAGTSSADNRFAGPSRFYAGAADGSSGDAAGQNGGGGGATGDAAATAGPGGARGSAASGGAANDRLASAGGASGGASGGAAGQPGSGAGGGGGSMQGPGMTGAGSAASAGGSAGGSASMSLAGQRGSNWASLATADRPVPLRRPIRIACTAQEFRLFDDGGRRIESRIPCPGATVLAVDPLVAAIHSRVAGWGIAGDRMYWKPELILAAAAGGEGRREELERLLADSGLDTRRAESQGRVERLPPVERTGAVGLQR